MGGYRNPIFNFTTMSQQTKDGIVFTIPEGTSPQLVELILNTESMDNFEKQYWFDIQSSMTKAQKNKLFDILETERIKLQELETRYQADVKQLIDKNLIEFQPLTK